MRTEIDDKEIEAVARVIERFGPAGASIRNIIQSLAADGLNLPRRTLNRRLSKLIDAKPGYFEVTGKGPSTRYLARPVPAAPGWTPGKPEPSRYLAEESAEMLIRFSQQAREIQHYVRQPIQRRKPTGYNRAFLDSYKPNQTEYLPKNIRDHLHAVGRPATGQLRAGTYVRTILNRLLIDLSWNSSRLEGNTYSLLETERLLAGIDETEGKAASEKQMILNHKAAIEFMASTAEELDFSGHVIRNIHALLSDNLLNPPEACGRLRTTPVSIGNSVYHPLEIPQLIQECFQQILTAAAAIIDPFEQAFFVMVHLPYLQPFDDVNKRVSRLAANIPLIRENLCPLSFTDVPVKDYVDGLLGIYELTRVDLLRDVFVWAYERSANRYLALRQSLGEPDPFRLKYRTKLKDTISAIVRNPAATEYSTILMAAEIPEKDRSQFNAIVELELKSLHEGNYARYSLRKSEFDAWHNAQTFGKNSKIPGNS